MDISSISSNNSYWNQLRKEVWSVISEELKGVHSKITGVEADIKDIRAGIKGIKTKVNDIKADARIVKEVQRAQSNSLKALQIDRFTASSEAYQSVILRA